MPLSSRPSSLQRLPNPGCLWMHKQMLKMCNNLMAKTWRRGLEAP